MPVVQLPDGRVVQFPDGMPESEINAVLAHEKFPEKPETPAGAGALSKAEGISETPKFQKDIYVPGMGTLPSAERMSEWLPAVGGTLGAAIGNVPGAVGGSVVGESVRQMLRLLAGHKPATGVIQEAAGLDPNSLPASIAGVAGEGGVALGGELAGKVLGGVKGATERSAQRSLVNLLQPATPVDRDMALKLTDRMVSEGIAPAGSTRTTQVARASSALEKAKLERDAALEAAKATGRPVPTSGVVEATSENIPANLTVTRPPSTGVVPRVGKGPRKAAEKVSEDVLDVVGGSQVNAFGDVPLDTAMAERKRWDDLLQRFYQRGSMNPPEGLAPSKVAADAWRGAIAKEFPELGAANLKVHELIDVNRMLSEAEKRIKTMGLLEGTASASALGAGAAGRMSIPAVIATKLIQSTGPWASASSATKRVVAKLLEAPIQTRQAWVRMHDFFNVEDQANAPQQ